MIYKVGLTGGIGCGKSTVADLFSNLGVPVFSADKIGRQLSWQGQPGYQAIVDLFGEDILDQQGQLNRTALGDIVFSNPALKKKLENILHPMIMQEIHESAEAQDAPYCVLDIPLLIGTPEQGKVDRILVVQCTLATRIARIKTRSGWTDDKIASVINAQPAQNLLLNAADDVIDNNGDIDDLVPQVEQLHHFYVSEFK